MSILSHFMLLIVCIIWSMSYALGAESLGMIMLPYAVFWGVIHISDCIKELRNYHG